VRWEYCDPLPSCSDETLVGMSGAGYRGCQNKTRSGLDCQAWSAQSPHAHKYAPQAYLSSGLDYNFCRNPEPADATIVSIWCYTTNPAVRWDYCNSRMSNVATCVFIYFACSGACCAKNKSRESFCMLCT
jgi:integrin beta 3